MQYWLMKSEPGEFSIDDLKRKKRSLWDGLRNYQVRNMLRDEMEAGDQAFFYHSNAGEETGIVGVMQITKKAYPDPTQFDRESKYYDVKSDPDQPRWLGVDVKFVEKLPSLISLAELRKEEKLSTLPLIRKGNRLSVMKLTEQEFTFILNMAKNKST